MRDIRAGRLVLVLVRVLMVLPAVHESPSTSSITRLLKPNSLFLEIFLADFGMSSLRLDKFSIGSSLSQRNAGLIGKSGCETRLYKTSASQSTEARW